MNLARVYTAFDVDKKKLQLSLETSHHLITVLRKKIGDNIVVFSGTNYQALAKIINITKKAVIVSLENIQFISEESTLSIHLVQAIPKGDKMHWIVQKAIELGVTSIIPVISERCAIKIDKNQWDKKCYQWQRVMIAACEQSGRNYLPYMQPISFLKDYLSKTLDNQGFILDPTSGCNWRHYPSIGKAITLLIGPEGGFSAIELDQALQTGFQRLQLGPRILRTETAGIAAISVLQAIYGDL